MGTIEAGTSPLCKTRTPSSPYDDKRSSYMVARRLFLLYIFSKNSQTYTLGKSVVGKGVVGSMESARTESPLSLEIVNAQGQSCYYLRLSPSIRSLSLFARLKELGSIEWKHGHFRSHVLPRQGSQCEILIPIPVIVQNRVRESIVFLFCMGSWYHF